MRFSFSSQTARISSTVLPYFDFDLEKCKANIHLRNPRATVIPVCAKTGEGIDVFAQWLIDQVAAWKER